MVDLLKAGAGTLSFFIGYALCLITQYIMPPMIAILSDTLAGIIWFALIVIWVLAMLVVPVGLMLWGVTIPSENQNPIFNVTIGILWFILGSAFIYFSYYMVTPLANMFTYPLLSVLFWIGLIALWIFNIGVIPTYFIIESKRE